MRSFKSFLMVGVVGAFVLGAGLRAADEGLEALPVGLTNLPPAVVDLSKVPSRSAEIIKMVEAGVDEKVIIAFIGDSRQRFSLSADDVTYLNDIGISSTLMTAMLEHDGKLPQSSPVVQTPPLTPPAVPSGAQTNEFYSALSPYGAWNYVDGVGWVWQPYAAVLNAEWSPYLDGGRWYDSDYGWYWHSYYAWGWAPFHYGRWWHHPARGWCWFPGHTWGPSWVSWRSHGDLCGWAPLGPTFAIGFEFGPRFWPFLPANHFFSRDLRAHRIPPHNVNQFFSKTAALNNITPGPHNTVLNPGLRTPAGSDVQRIPAVRVNSLAADSPATVRPDRVVRSGSGLSVFRAETPAVGAVHAPPVVMNSMAGKAPATAGNISPPMSRGAQGWGSVFGTPRRARDSAIAEPGLSRSPGSVPSMPLAAPSERRVASSPSTSSGMAVPSYTPGPRTTVPSAPRAFAPVAPRVASPGVSSARSFAPSSPSSGSSRNSGSWGSSGSSRGPSGSAGSSRSSGSSDRLSRSK